MAAGDLTARANIQTRDELDLLGRSFNTMAERVEDIVATLQRFIADAAHELHTPITTLGVNLELASEEDPNLSRYLANAQTQTTRLQALIDSMLDLSRIEAGSQKRVRFSLSQLLQEIEKKFTNEADQKGITFNLEILCPGGADFCGDLSQVRRAVENLVDNALKFTPSGGEVFLRLEEKGRFCHLTVQDSGIGIPTENLPEIFQRFHRGRNATTFPGSGLGLAIVKAILDQHEAEIQIESDSNGTRVIVTFPLKP
jgi:signal transduction histidine kinase